MASDSHYDFTALNLIPKMSFGNCFPRCSLLLIRFDTWFVIARWSTHHSVPKLRHYNVDWLRQTLPDPHIWFYVFFLPILPTPHCKGVELARLSAL